MTLTDFMSNVDKDDELEGVDTTETEVIVKDKSGTPVRIKAIDILDHEWKSIRNGIIGSQPVYTVTRVCGYFSRTHNFNSSKIGELNDRRAAKDYYADFG